MVGARPQFIKAAAVSAKLRERHLEVLVHTGQHYDDDMSERFFRELSIPKPDIELGVGSGPHGEQTGKMLAGIEAAVVERRPHAVLVYGDTNSTLAGALAAAKLHVPVAHVEAGLRSFNRRMPEEINRIVTDTLSTLLFCPSASAAANLEREGITKGVHVVGDVMAEALRQFSDPRQDEEILRRFDVKRHEYAVLTVHRAENSDSDELFRVIHALSFVGIPIVFPVHPRIGGVRAMVFPESIRVTSPIAYSEMTALTRNARVVVTDSGGLQKEAYWLGTPCITLRNETEWTETVDHGWNRLTGLDPERVAAAVSNAARLAVRPPLYGEGGAVDAIVDRLKEI